MRVGRGQTGRVEAVRSVVVVEGQSDKVALETLARRLGRDLHAERVSVVPVGGAQAIGRVLDDYGSRGTELRSRGSATRGKSASSDVRSSAPASVSAWG